ncbi:MAG: hypothetical protein FWD46_07695 [Cystobacterineae bacterium]|nr:hypothetical protein [Cystobacterineae bacterium]
MKKKIGEILIAREVVSAEDIGEALALQVEGDPNRLGEILVQQGRLGADALARALAEQKALPYTELNLVSSSFAQKVPLKFQHRHGLIPFEEAAPGEFYIAVADPMATDAIERAKNWLKAKSIQLYMASSDEIERVLSALEDQELVSGEVLLSSERGSVQKKSELSEEDLFGSLQFDEEGPATGVVSSLKQQSKAGRGPRMPDRFEETTQVVSRPGPPPEVDTDAETVFLKADASSRKVRKLSVFEVSEDAREKTPRSNLSESLPSLSPLGAQLAEFLEGKGAAELADVVIGLADLLVKKSVLSREEVWEIFASSPTEKW